MNTVADKSLPLHELLSAPEIEGETLDLVRYWRAIGQSKWRILLLAIAVGVLATLAANSLRPTYRSTATILIESSKLKLVSIEEVYSQLSSASTAFYQTQAEILKSRELALLGAGLAILIERLNNTLKTSHDVEQKLGVPVLGVLQITKVKRGQQLERVFLEDPQTPFSESIRTIRSGVCFRPSIARGRSW